MTTTPEEAARAAGCYCCCCCCHDDDECYRRLRHTTRQQEEAISSGKPAASDLALVGRSHPHENKWSMNLARLQSWLPKLRTGSGESILTGSNIHHNHNLNPNLPQHRNNHNQQHHKSLLASILLPLLCMFLLPSLKLVDHNNHHHHSQTFAKEPHSLAPSAYGSPLPMAASELLLALLRLPFDRLRLVSGLRVAEAKDVMNRRQDLQEEETHMQMLMPAEHRNLYAASGATGGQSMVSSPRSSIHHPHHHHHHHQQRVSPPGTEIAYVQSAGEPGAQQVGGADQVAVAPSDYGVSTADQAETGSMGSVEGTSSVAEPASSQAGGSGGLQTRGDLPAVRALNVKCEKNHMTVNIVFDRPFYGLVFSKGHYNDQKCVHLPANSGQTSINFDIHLGKCGMSSSDASGNPNAAALHQQQQQQLVAGGQQQPNGLYIENTIIIQYDPQVQEIYDQARKLRCTWYDYYEKSVTFRPYNVDMLDAVTANFLGDNIQCWMQIQVGKGPWSSEVAGIVKIGQTMTMVLAIKDDENRFDMLVRNCVAHDGKHQPIQLVDEYGCVARPKIMAKFQKVRNFGPAATVVSYAHFQAFKFPDSMSVHFQCVIQVCRYECPEPVCSGSGSNLPSTGGGGGAATSATSGELAGGQSSPSADYAASGTEIVASKEPLPVGDSRTYHFMANNSMVASSPGGHGSVNLKLDESQGRVQVKLDTSMMAGSGGGGGSRIPAGHGGAALPPHLLHTAASEQGPAPVPPGYISARPSPTTHMGSYYKPIIASSQGGLPASQRNANTVAGGSQGGATNGRPPMLNNGRGQLAPSGAQRSTHFSSPYSHHHQQQQQLLQQPSVLTHRFYATNRIGELPVADTSGSGGGGSDDDGSTKQVADPAPSGSQQQQLQLQLQLQPAPLSLIAIPRGLRTSQRQRRSVAEASANINGTRQLDNHHLNLVAQLGAAAFGSSHPVAARSIPQGQEEADSTSIRTQKTIQVVSPDDMAFSLMEDHTPGEPLISVTSGVRRQDFQSTVCFSAARLIVAILVTVAALLAGLIVVAYLVMRQRARQADSDKLASLYEPELDTPTPTNSSCQQYGLAQGVYFQQPAVAQHPSVCQLQPEVGEEEDAYQQQQQQVVAAANNIISAHRQHREIQQRNNYLARLYSQFVPANYWRS